MSRFLSENNIIILEQFIQENKVNEILPAISEYYREQAIEDWKTINDPNTPPTTYLQFADSAYGMVSYGFYKTKSGSIYMITAYCNEISAHFSVSPSWNILIPYDKLPQPNFNIPDDDSNIHTIESASETDSNTPESQSINITVS